jgi:hypothetical protein
MVSLLFTATALTSGDDPNIEAARRFRKLLAAKEYKQARSMMTENPRRWFNQRQGEGRPWIVKPGAKGPWAKWDEHFRSRKEELRWESGKNNATLFMKETNDYFQLLERGWVTTEIIYLFDNAGKIEGLLIRATGKRPPGRTEEFLKWAREHHPGELEYLMPGGDIDPTGDRPGRFRTLLNKWRKSAGLPVIE